MFDRNIYILLILEGGSGKRRVHLNHQSNSKTLQLYLDMQVNNTRPLPVSDKLFSMAISCILIGVEISKFQGGDKKRRQGLQVVGDVCIN